jgi:hypothetical protein
VTAYDLVKRGHCRPIPTGLDKKVGRVRFSFDVSELPAAEAVNAFLAEHAPPVLDPFCGGGSIPLEAQRLGLRAYASDLNPVPVLINKALIEIPPKFAGRPPVNPASRPYQPEAPARDAGSDAATDRPSLASRDNANRPSLARRVGMKKQQDLMAREWPGATGLAEDIRYYGQWMFDDARESLLNGRRGLNDWLAHEFCEVTATVRRHAVLAAENLLVGICWLAERRCRKRRFPARNSLWKNWR